jgi:hypothetical protein
MEEISVNKFRQTLKSLLKKQFPITLLCGLKGEQAEILL